MGARGCGRDGAWFCPTLLFFPLALSFVPCLFPCFALGWAPLCLLLPLRPSPRAERAGKWRAGQGWQKWGPWGEGWDPGKGRRPIGHSWAPFFICWMLLDGTCSPRSLWSSPQRSPAIPSLSLRSLVDPPPKEPHSSLFVPFSSFFLLCVFFVLCCFVLFFLYCSDLFFCSSFFNNPFPHLFFFRYSWSQYSLHALFYFSFCFCFS